MFVHFVLKGEVLPVQERDCEDIQVTHRALRAVKDAAGRGTTVNVGECGAAYRFMTPLLAVTPGKWCLTGSHRLLQRPIEELVEVLNSIGGDVCRHDDGIHFNGRELFGSRLAIDCRRSSQFASALILVAPKIGLRELTFSSREIPSKPYIQLTRLCTPWHVAVADLPAPNGPLGRVGDWSAALFWYAKAAIAARMQSVACVGENQDVTTFELLDLSLRSAQGDAVVADWFARLGVESEETEAGVRITARRRDLVPTLHFDVAEHPDVVPVLAVTALLLSVDATFLHTQNLRYKESDRSGQLALQLAPFAKIDCGDDFLRVRARAREAWPTPPYEFRTMNDHRLAMAFLLFGEDAHIDDMGCLAKSYPQLIDILQCDM